MRATEAVPESKPTIYVVDSDGSSRQLIKEALTQRGGHTEAYDSFDGFLSQLCPDQAGTVLLDLDVRLDQSHCAAPPLGYFGGLAALRKLRMFPCPPPVILLATDLCWEVAVESMKLGCLDILSKPVKPYRLLEAVSLALQHFQATQSRMAQRRAFNKRLSTLTPSEREVLDLLCEGYVNKQIAGRLSLSVRTIELRRAKILSKMGAGSLGQLIQMVSSFDWEARAVG